ncbi:MAG: 3-keto-5-aminohexanoate cleavage protein [Coprococcus sp.]
MYATDDTRLEHVQILKPEMASYDCGSMNWLNCQPLHQQPCIP